MHDTLYGPAGPGPIDAAGLVGQVLDGRYALERKLGAGGMGVVYAARHTVLGARLAVKVLVPPPSEHADESMERFRREARAASALGHPNIVAVRDFGALPNGLTYYVMEHLDGTDLLDEIERHPSGMPEERVARIGRQIAEALGAAHEQGIVHRDLKPENVFLIERGGRPDHVKLIDFGIAKVNGPEAGHSVSLPPGEIDARSLLGSMDSTGGRRFTAAGVVLGTPVYMSPEQCAGREVDGRSDLYALGVLLFEALTGRPPFDAPSVLELMRLHQVAAPPDPRTFRPGLGREIAELVLNCLEKSPTKRPMDMHEVAERLALVSPPDPIAASAPSVPALPPAPRPAAPPPENGPRFSTQAALAPAPPKVEREAPPPRTLRTWLLVALAIAAPSVSLGVAVGLWFEPPGATTAAPGEAAAVPSAPPPPLDAGTRAPPVVAPSAVPSAVGAPASGAPAPVADPVSAPVLAPPADAHARHRAHHDPLAVDPPPVETPPVAPDPAARPSRPRPTDPVLNPWGD
jgi:serine/threonine-protein kinase